MDGTYPVDIEVPGQYQLSPGVPLRLVDSRQPELTTTYACVITLESIARVDPALAKSLRLKFESVRNALLGDPSNSLPGQSSPIAKAEAAAYDLDFKANLRDSGNHELGGEGSFSLAVTSGEGQGIGHVQPAVQTDTPEVQQRRRLIVTTFGDLAVDVLELALTREEFSALRRLGLQNNVPGFGSIRNVFLTGCQLNITFITLDAKSLFKSLGRHQGCNHVDPHDCIACFTVVYMLLRLPRGSDPGAFVFAEYGVYARSFSKLYETDDEIEYVVILVFRGRNIHGGEAPRLPPRASTVPFTEEQRRRAVRMVLVGYASTTTVLRTGTLAAGPPAGFGSTMDNTLTRHAQLNMTQHGLDILGTAEHRSTWAVKEGAFSQHNVRATQHALGVTTRFRSHLLEDVEREWYLDDDGVEQQCRLGDVLDRSVDRDEHDEELSNVAWLFVCGRHFSLRILKREVLKARELARENRSADYPLFSTNALQKQDGDVLDVAQVQHYLNNKKAYLVRLSTAVDKWVWIADSDWLSGDSKDQLLSEFLLEGAAGSEEELTLDAAGACPCRDCTVAAAAFLQEEGESQDKDADVPSPRGTTPALFWGSSTPSPAPAPSIPLPRDVNSLTPSPIQPSAALPTDPSLPVVGPIPPTPARPLTPPAFGPTSIPEQDDDSRMDEGDDGVERDKGGAGGGKRKRDDADLAEEASRPPPKRGGNRGSKKTKGGGSAPKPTVPPSAVDKRRLFTALEMLSYHVDLDGLQRGRALFSRTDQRYNSGPALAQLLRDFQTQSSINESLQPNTKQHSLQSIRLVVQCARIQGMAEKVTHLALMIERIGRIALCQSIVHLAQWLTGSAPVLAAYIFGPVAQGKVPETLGIPWLDDLVTKLYKYAQDNQNGGSGLTPVKKSFEKIIAVTVSGQENADLLRDLEGAREGDTQGPVEHGDGSLPPDLPPMSPLTEVEVSEEEEEEEEDDDDDEVARRRRTRQPRILRESIRASVPSAILNARPGDMRELQYTVSRTRIARGPHYIFGALKDIFVEVLFGMLVYPTVRQTMSRYLPKVEGSAVTVVHRTMAYLVAAGSVLRALKDAAGTHVIWSFHIVEVLLWRSPHLLVPQTTTYLRMGDAILNGDKPGHVQALTSTMNHWFATYPKARQALENMEDPLVFHLNEIQLGRPIRPPFLPSLFTPKDGKGGAGARVRSQIQAVPFARTAVVRTDLQFFDSRPLEFASFMLSASIALQEKDTTGVAELDAFLNGQHPTQRNKELRFTRDQLCAVPAFWKVIGWIGPLLKLEVLRQPWGLCNLLAVFGSGQSIATERFLKGWMRDIPKSAQEMVDIWKAATHLNKTVLLDIEDGCHKLNERLLREWPDYSPVENMCVWGTASHMISFGCNGDHIWDWFSEDVSASWLEYLAHYDLSGPPTWDYAYDFIISLDVAPFKGDTLSTMHVTNRLAEAGLCMQPSSLELACWVGRHSNRGAYAGLLDVGFKQLPNMELVVLAFTAFHAYLDTHLTEAQKTQMQFSVITTENLLCKIIRVRKLVKLLKFEPQFKEWMRDFMDRNPAVAIHVDFDVTAFLAGGEELTPAERRAVEQGVVSEDAMDITL